MIQYGLHSAPDQWASEYEVSEFLGAMVRLLKPKVILETGFYQGHTAKAMAEAAKVNGIGFVFSCDTNQSLVVSVFGKSISNSNKLPLSVSVEKGEQLAGRIENVDLAFIDSSGDRVAEVQALQLSPVAVVVLHDSKRPQYKPIWTAHPWRTIWDIPTEQGLTIFIL